MEDSNRPKIILLILFVAVVILGYFLFQRLITSKDTQKIPTVNQQVTVSASPVPPSLPIVLNPTPSPKVAASPVVVQNGAGTKKLPSTGAADVLLVIFAASVLIGGFFLRKYPQ